MPPSQRCGNTSYFFMLKACMPCFSLQISSVGMAIESIDLPYALTLFLIVPLGTIISSDKAYTTFTFSPTSKVSMVYSSLNNVKSPKFKVSSEIHPIS
jgi:predicted nucleic acid-binding protein